MSGTFEIVAVEPLTRAEDAYLHLAAFQQGDRVDIGGPRVQMAGVITVPQRIGEPSFALEDTFVIVDPDPQVFGWGRLDLRRVVRVKHLLSGQYTIGPRVGQNQEG